MASLTQRTWVWVNSGSCWETGKPGMLQSMGSQSQTRLSNWTELNMPACYLPFVALAYTPSRADASYNCKFPSTLIFHFSNICQWYLNFHFPKYTLWLPSWFSGKESAWPCRKCRFDPQIKRIPWRRAWQPAPVLMPGESHGQRSLAGYSLWGHRVWDDLTTKTTTTKYIYWLPLCHG